MNSAMFAIIKKDFRSITSNRNLFASLLIVPLVLAVVLPSVFVCLIHFAPDDPDIQKLMELLPRAAQSESLELAAAGLIFNYILPVFFLMIPIMAASIMAASSFGNTALLPFVGQTDFPFQGACFFSAQYGGNLSLLFQYDTGTGDRNLYSHGQFPSPRDQLAAPPDSGRTCRHDDRHYTDRPRLREGTERGRVSAKRCIPGHSGHFAGSRTVYRSTAAESLAPVRAWHGVCRHRLDTSQKMYGTFYL